MTKINDIKRIQVDLLKLKPIKSQEEVYNSYNKYLAKYFNNRLPNEEFFEKINCPLCKQKNDSVLIKIDLFEYIRCNVCDTIYNNPRLKKEFLEKMYSEGEYENYVKNLTSPGDQIRKNITEVRKFNQLKSLFDFPGKVLDVGCGAGVFLTIASDNNWDCTGIELSKSGLNAAQEKGVNIIEGSFDNYQSNKKFNCITFWGVLEHVVNPIEQIKKAVSLLDKNGVLIFEVPSADSLLMKYVIEHGLVPYRYIESARHLSFFSLKAIKMICEQQNLNLEYIESNGLDLQTVLLQEFDSEIIKKIKNIQQLIDKNLFSDHYRVFLRKI